MDGRQVDLTRTHATGSFDTAPSPKKARVDDTDGFSDVERKGMPRTALPDTLPGSWSFVLHIPIPAFESEHTPGQNHQASLSQFEHPFTYKMIFSR